MEIRWVSRGNVLLGFVGQIYAFRIIRGFENLLETRLPGTYEQLSRPDVWDKRLPYLKELAGARLEEFRLNAGFAE